MNTVSPANSGAFGRSENASWFKAPCTVVASELSRSEKAAGVLASRTPAPLVLYGGTEKLPAIDISGRRGFCMAEGLRRTADTVTAESPSMVCPWASVSTIVPLDWVQSAVPEKREADGPVSGSEEVDGVRELTRPEKVTVNGGIMVELGVKEKVSALSAVWTARV